jgi:hypothetical protein
VEVTTLCLREFMGDLGRKLSKSREETPRFFHDLLTPDPAVGGLLIWVPSKGMVDGTPDCNERVVANVGYPTYKGRIEPDLSSIATSHQYV